MLRRILLNMIIAVVALVATMNLALAQVEVNKGDLVALESIKGIGPATAKRILDERTKGGNFKDWSDFESRIKGIGEKSAIKLSQAGLQVNGQTKLSASAAVPNVSSAKVSAKTGEKNAITK